MFVELLSRLPMSTLPQLEFGVVYSCIEDKMYTGRKGKGAFCNGEALQVSDQRGGWVVVCVWGFACDS